MSSKFFRVTVYEGEAGSCFCVTAGRMAIRSLSVTHCLSRNRERVARAVRLQDLGWKANRLLLVLGIPQFLPGNIPSCGARRGGYLKDNDEDRKSVV